MTYLWINPVSERMVSEQNLKRILTEHQLTQVRCQEDWGGIVLKQYAEPLLFGIPQDAPEYAEAKRLLKFLDYFLGVGSENIPHNSMIREFIGGSCFKV